MQKSGFEIYGNDDERFVQIGDYVLLKNEEDRKEYDSRTFNNTKGLNINTYPVLVSLVQGEENMSFIPLTKKDLLEMIELIDRSTH
jgi:hypothetical protein